MDSSHRTQHRHKPPGDIAEPAASFVYDANYDAFPSTARGPVEDRHQPVFTTVVGADLILTVVRVDLVGRRPSFQLYSCGAGHWALTGLFGTIMDACAEVQSWRAYVARGGSLATWQAAHPDGVQAGGRS
jgi:hypothetical protein